MKLISFDIQSDFGFFRKPETNNTLNVSYNMIHKPAILGLLGAIIGLKGYQKKGKLPEYYQKLSSVKIGIAPLEDDKGNYTKTPIKYSNTVGYANKGSNFLTEELTLIAPKYRIYLLLDESKAEQKQLIENIQYCQTEFIPYFGKNEFMAWWDNFQEYDFEAVKDNNKIERISIATLFLKNEHIVPLLEEKRSERGKRDKTYIPFYYFERLPIGFNIELMQYELKDFIYTNNIITSSEKITNLYYLNSCNCYVQLL